MAHSEARAWWADVQHLRDGYERTDEARRRADEADLASRRATRERHHVDAEVLAVRAPRGSRTPASVAPRRVSGPEAPVRRGQVGPEASVRRSQAGSEAPVRSGQSGPEAPVRRGQPGPELSSRLGDRADAGGFDAHAEFAVEPEQHGDAASGRRPRVKGSATPGRRTIEIRGRTVPAPMVPRPVETDRRRPPRRAIERVGGRPDRIAMWALLMGLLLILVAIGTADSPAVVALFAY
jgi:hypothetical protein